MLFSEMTVINGMIRTKDALQGERTFRTYEAWKRACKEIEPNVKFDGDKDICQAGKIGEWDGAEGVIYKTKDTADSNSFKEGDIVKIVNNESFNGRKGEFIKEYSNPKKGIIAIVDVGGVKREFPFDNLSKDTKDSYNYNGKDYEKEDLWKLLVKEGKTKRFKELTEAQQNGRTDQYALFQSNGGIYAVVRDTKDIKLNETPDSEFDAKELALGIKTEMEHTDNLQEATSIAKDHLQELPDYYSKLVKMEAKDAERIDLKCTYANGDIIRTGFNGTLQDAKDYFLNKTFNLGQGENDKMVKCIKVEQV